MTEYRPTDLGGVPQPPPGRRGMMWGPAIAMIGAVVIAAGITVWATLDPGSLGAQHPSASATTTASASPSPSPSPTADAQTGWTRMTSTDGEFSIAVPQQPEVLTQQMMLRSFGIGQTTLYRVPGTDGGRLSFSRTRVTRPPAEATPEAAAQRYLDDVTSVARSGEFDGMVLTSLGLPANVGALPGLRAEITVVTAERSETYVVAVAVSGNDIYQFVAGDDQSANLDSMLSSFTILR